MTGFVPPPYPYDRLHQFKPLAERFEGGLLDFSIGTPNDPPPPKATAALDDSATVRGYPPSLGSLDLRNAVKDWLARRVGVTVDLSSIAATVGSKEFVATLPQWMRLRTPGKDTVLYPATSYPTYEMGAILSGCRPVPVPTTPEGTLDLDALDDSDVERALLLWCNSPSNPTGAVEDLGKIAEWGRARSIPVFSDECYIDFIWEGPPRSILQHGLDGVVGVFSLSKRSNLAGARVGYYAGDPELVGYLSEVRKHVGMMPAGPCQSAATIALADDAHVEVQRGRYRARLEKMAWLLEQWTGRACPLPDGTFYLWFPVDDAWAFTERLAELGGALVTPGEFFGPLASRNIRVALVQSEDKIDLLAERLGMR